MKKEQATHQREIALLLCLTSFSRTPLFLRRILEIQFSQHLSSENARPPRICGNLLIGRQVLTDAVICEYCLSQLTCGLTTTHRFDYPI